MLGAEICQSKDLPRTGSKMLGALVFAMVVLVLLTIDVEGTCSGVPATGFRPSRLSVLSQASPGHGSMQR